MNQYQTRIFYKKINRIWKDYKPQLTLCKEEGGEIINKREEILKRWQG
jgi:hypothetical protein